MPRNGARGADQPIAICTAWDRAKSVQDALPVSHGGRMRALGVGSPGGRKGQKRRLSVTPARRWPIGNVAESRGAPVSGARRIGITSASTTFAA